MDWLRKEPIAHGCGTFPPPPNLTNKWQRFYLPAQLNSHLSAALPPISDLCAADIVAGQGMYFSPDTKLFRAANCETDNYGVSNKTTGLAAYPCRACPAGMQTSVSLTNSNTYHATNGFYDPKACVTKVGYGYNGRVATQCRPDSYNAAGNYGTCTQCPTGAPHSTSGLLGGLLLSISVLSWSSTYPTLLSP